jgi:hypothetical protein
VPYIHPDDRPDLTPGALVYASHPGDLNFQITTLCDEYLNGAVNYDAINEVIGVLECAKLELYRRVAAPYEDAKIKENTDVYRHRSFM